MWNKPRAYLQLITKFYLNNHYSMIIGKCYWKSHWKVLYQKEDFKIEKWISLLFHLKGNI